MGPRTLKIALSGTGFAADFTVAALELIPHQNGVALELAGVTSGKLENARRFAEARGVAHAFADHRAMLDAVRPDIDFILSANLTHGPYVREAAEARVPVIALEKPPVLWPGYPAGRSADAATRTRESMADLAEVLDAVRAGGSKLLYAENFVYVDGVFAFVELLREVLQAPGGEDKGKGKDKGRILYQRGVCAHQGSHAPAYDTPALSGGGALFNKACHPLGPCLYLKQVEGLLRDGRPIRPRRVSAVALQVLKHLPPAAGEHFRVMQNVDDFGRITVEFEDRTVAEVLGYDLSISGIRNELSIVADFAQFDVRINPADEHELFLPRAESAGRLLLREKLPTPAGTSFPRPLQARPHGYANEAEDAVACALDATRFPQSGPLMAWDSMAVLMAGYESAERDAAFVPVDEWIQGRAFRPEEMPDPSRWRGMFQRTS
jgi:predicted dehydrogenase